MNISIFSPSYYFFPTCHECLDILYLGVNFSPTFKKPSGKKKSVGKNSAPIPTIRNLEVVDGSIK